MSRPTPPATFDPRGPLPSGLTLLEASAGTGKTFTISGLTARYIADGTQLSELLLVTFTRVATSELRDRVRGRLVDIERELSWQLAGGHLTTLDEVALLLAEGPREEVTLRRHRIRSALAGFDAATIATTHSFCEEVLDELGTAGDIVPGTEFLEDPEEILGEVVDDLYARAFVRKHDAPFTRSHAGKIAAFATGNPGVPVEPAAADPESLPGMRRRLAVGTRAEFDARRQRMAIMTYNDQLTRLCAILAGPNGAAAIARLNERYKVVLVDEFQDTDPLQWEILETGFAIPGAGLVLIADPKQAIYAFRGADVYAYLQAQNRAGVTQTLEINWRSDRGLIDAYDELFADAQLGHERIVYRQVKAPPAHRAPRLLGAPVAEPLRIRIVRRDNPHVSCGNSGYVEKDAADSYVVADLVADLVRLLESDAQIEVRTEEGEYVRHETVRPRHTAVLVRTNKQAGDVQRALLAAGVPAVIGGAGSVFSTQAASDWLDLLEALERPASAPRASTVAITPFMGWSAERLAAATESELGDVHQRLHQWARILRDRGVAALMQAVALSQGLAARVLSIRGGERVLTDLRHVAELLHATARADQLGPTGLATWLRARIDDSDADVKSEERTRRLESDAAATQVATIHSCKGLEFPVVYCPFLWNPTWIRPREPIAFHDPHDRDARKIDVGLEGPDWDAHAARFREEARGEDLRLMYVALTRAMHQAVTWWVPTPSSNDSALGRLAFSQRADGTIPSAGSVKPSDDQAVARFQELAAQSGGHISVEQSRLGSLPAYWSGEPHAEPELSVAGFDRKLDLRWQRASYSSITAPAHDAWVASEPELQVEFDEPQTPAPAPDGDGDQDALPEFQRVSSWQTLPVGVNFGSAVHRIMQLADFAAPDLESELRSAIDAATARRADEAGDLQVLLRGLTEVIETPLGALLLDRRLRDLEAADRLNELEFELPLVGGDDPTGRLTLGVIGDVLRQHLGPDDPLFAYAERLADPLLRASVRGYLTGSIDLVLRVCGGGRERFAIADYKTNWLAPPDVDLLLWHYRPAVLRSEMLRAHYGLQALLYLTALHRYLRWRVPDYNPAEQLAGVSYLFLRGMAGDDTPAVDDHRCGVFGWRPEASLVEALSAAVDEGIPS